MPAASLLRLCPKLASCLRLGKAGSLKFSQNNNSKKNRHTAYQIGEFLEFYKYKKLLADRRVLWLIEMMNNKCWLEIDLQIMSPASFGKLLFQEY